MPSSRLMSRPPCCAGTAETPQEGEEDARRSAAGSPAWEDGATGTADTWDGWGVSAEPPVANNAPPGNDPLGEEAGDGSASDWAALSEGEQEEQVNPFPLRTCIQSHADIHSKALIHSFIHSFIIIHSFINFCIYTIALHVYNRTAFWLARHRCSAQTHALSARHV